MRKKQRLAAPEDAIDYKGNADEFTYKLIAGCGISAIPLLALHPNAKLRVSAEEGSLCMRSYDAADEVRDSQKKILLDSVGRYFAIKSLDNVPVADHAMWKQRIAFFARNCPTAIDDAPAIKHKTLEIMMQVKDIESDEMKSLMAHHDCQDVYLQPTDVGVMVYFITNI